MAFVDLTPSAEEAASAGATWDCVSDRYLEPALSLLPPGKAWRGGALREVVGALMWEFSRVWRAGQALFDECDPRTASTHLVDWERILGLPECAEPTTIAGRRVAAAVKLAAASGHTQSLAWWTSVALSLGVEILFIEQGPGPFAVGDPVTTSLGSDEWEQVWTIIAEHVAAEDEAAWECFQEHNASLDTLALTHWRWATTTSGTANDLAAVASGSGYVVAVGASGTVRVSVDDGATWSAGLGGLANGVAGIGHASSTWIAVDDTGQIYRTVDVGAVAFNTTDTLADAGTAVDPAPFYGPGFWQFASVDPDPKIWVSDDDGASVGGPARPAAVSMRAATHDDTALIQVGDGGVIWRSTDSGGSWGAVTSPVSDDLRGAAARPGVMVAVGDTGTIIRSTDSGSSWSEIGSPVSDDLFAVAAGDRWWYAVGDNGVIIESEDDGATWSEVDSPTTSPLRGVCVHRGRAVAVGDGGVIVIE